MTKDLALAEAGRALRATFPERAELIIAVLEDAVHKRDTPSAEFTACLEAAKAGAKFSMNLNERRSGRRRGGAYIEISFDSRAPEPKPSRVPDLVQEADTVTFSSRRRRGPRE